MERMLVLRRAGWVQEGGVLFFCAEGGGVEMCWAGWVRHCQGDECVGMRWVVVVNGAAEMLLGLEVSEHH